MKSLLNIWAVLSAAIVISFACLTSCNDDDDYALNVERVTINPNPLSLVINTTGRLTATLLPAQAGNKNVTWESDNPDIASVDADGKVTGLSEGDAVITVTTEDGGKTAKCQVKITSIAIPVESVTLSEGAVTLKEGKTKKISADIAPAFATNKTIIWSSSNPDIATVSEDGTITAVSEGITVITATSEDGSHTADCEVNVRPLFERPTEIAMNLSELSLSEEENMQLSATVTPAEAVGGLTLIWSSDKENIATVDETGLVTAVAVGNATITVTIEGYENLTASCAVTVVYSPGKEYGISTVLVKAGTFKMGSTYATDPGRYGAEEQHTVTLTKDFYMSKFEITNEQFARFLNENNVEANGKLSTSSSYADKELIRGSKSQDNARDWGLNYVGDSWIPAEGKEKFPVVYVSWFGAYEYAKWIGGSLPTEAQWEYACRAGTATALPFGTGWESDLASYAWYNANSGGRTHVGGELLPNQWGLYDMFGNVDEWCQDVFVNFGKNAVTDPVVESGGTNRVSRGNAWDSAPLSGTRWVNFRSANRGQRNPATFNRAVGFRVVFPSR